MLIVLHFRLFLMPYDSGGMSLGDSEFCWVLFSVLKDALSDNTMFD